jgi:hypothetical protein
MADEGVLELFNSLLCVIFKKTFKFLRPTYKKTYLIDESAFRTIAGR